MAFLGTLPMATIRNCSSQVWIKYSMKNNKTSYPPGAKSQNEGGKNLAKLTPVKVCKSLLNVRGGKER